MMMLTQYIRNNNNSKYVAMVSEDVCRGGRVKYKEDRRIVGTSADSLKDDEMESLIVYEPRVKSSHANALKGI